jgi:hypothetical protein
LKSGRVSRPLSFLRRIGRRLSAEASWRGSVLADCIDLLEKGEIRLTPDGWGALQGFAGGHPASIIPMCESLAYRRLPQLWLAVTVRLRRPGCCILDIVRRSTNAEFYAPAVDLPERFEVPAQWPQDTLVKGDGPRAGEALAQITEPLTPLFSDVRVKEVLIDRQRVRILFQARQGSRGFYLLFRQTRFDIERMGPQDVAGFLRSATRIADQIDALRSLEGDANAAAIQSA